MFMSTQITFAFSPKDTPAYFNAPTVTNITSNSATLFLNSKVLSDITPEEKVGIYFQYSETNQICIAIYPTPAECLPKKTEIGKTEIDIVNLKPNTSYSVYYKRDNTIRCITTPCPSNEFQSQPVEFITKNNNISSSTNSTSTLTKNLFFGSHDKQVFILQKNLIEKHYLKTSANGYFGRSTLKAVKKFQKANGLTPTGFVGPKTRAALMSTSLTGEYFEGVVSAYSTNCFADGICSITVGGKIVILIVGRKQGPLGQLKGVESISDISKKIGSTAKVYAAKTTNGYTLYGNNDFYVDIK